MENESFRDHLGNTDSSGKRIRIFPKIIKGKLYKYRTWISYILLTILFASPWIFINGNPLFLFNIIERKFILFSVRFWPQDFYLFVVAMLSMLVFIIVFTVIYGRIFCGWVCPQTIFLEMVFRKIEFWIEGTVSEQKKLATQAWNAEKIRKKLSKHSIFFFISFLISNTFLAYIIGSKELLKIITDNPSNHLVKLFSILLFTLVFYLVFAKVRELVCIWACPYGRLQGVLLDKNSIVVAYDYKRGEPRAKLNKKNPVENAGDCVDCNLCVDVCPTGIDIRNGTQLECVNCTACIDACDQVMVKINKPTGLIRFDSLEGIEKQKPFKFTTRMAAYTMVLSALVIFLIFLLVSRSSLEAHILRTPGLIFQEHETHISNLYNYELINKSQDSSRVTFELLNSKGYIQVIGQETNQIKLKPEEINKSSLFIFIPKNEMNKGTLTLEILVSGTNGEQIIETKFIGPANY